MFKTNYKTTLKAILRSPVSFLALCATVILAFAMYETGSSQILTIKHLRQDIMNQASSTCSSLFPAFVGIMVSAHILSEKQNSVSDLLLCSRKSFASIYLSKLCAIATAAIAAGLLFFGVRLIWYWGFHYYEAYGRFNIGMPLGEILVRYFLFILMFMPLLLLCYTAMAVFVSTVTNVPAAGAVWNVTFYISSFFWFKFRESNFYLPPYRMITHIRSFNEIAIDDPNFKALLVNYFIDEHVAPGFFGWIAVSIVLLMVSYFILKQRYRT